jgi:hypothetical protein
MPETRKVKDPFLGRDVEVSDKLVDRLRGQYACGPIMPNGEPEFGWRHFPVPRIQGEAADRIEQLEKQTSWNSFDHEDPSTWPTENGTYAVMVKGDSEREGPHVYYEFNDYQTFANLVQVSRDPDDCFISFKGIHDEEAETFFAWYGPLVIPKYEEKK